MSYILRKLDNFNRKHLYNQYFIDMNGETYSFVIRWSDYCQCAFLNILDSEDNAIVSGKALTNHLKIRNNKIPHILYFVNIYGNSYEPTIDNIAKEFGFLFNDEEVIQ